MVCSTLTVRCAAKPCFKRLQKFRTLDAIKPEFGTRQDEVSGFHAIRVADLFAVLGADRRKRLTRFCQIPSGVKSLSWLPHLPELLKRHFILFRQWRRGEAPRRPGGAFPLPPP